MRGRTRRRPIRNPSSCDRSRHRPPHNPSSRDLNRCHAIFAVVARAAPIVARHCTRRRALRTRRRALRTCRCPFFLNSRTRCRALRTRRSVVQTRRRRSTLHTRRRAVQTHRCDPFRARPTPVRTRPISMRAFYYFPALCQSIPACTCHGDCLRDSLKGASHFSSHVIHHD